MRRSLLVLSVLAMALFISACRRQKAQVEADRKSSSPNPSLPAEMRMNTFSLSVVGPPTNAALPAIPSPAPMPGTESEFQDKYDAAIQNAVESLAEHKYEEAIASLELARSINPTDFVLVTLSRTKQKWEQETAAARIAADIQTVLDEGRPADAAQLAADALHQFGHTTAVAAFARLKKQADALVAVQLTDRKDRRERFESAHRSAMKEYNLRAAVLALEALLELDPDEALKSKLEELRTKLATFDDLRSAAARLRSDPSSLEDAVDKLRKAADVWDTPWLRQEIEEYEWALQNRRERLAVAAFEVRGDVGIPEAGAWIADELLPAFKSRYDLVERGTFAELVRALNLSESRLVEDEVGRRESTQLAKARYLVVGSVVPVSGITVNARLIDTSTGLIVQTGRIAAATPQDLTTRLPELAKILLMDDDEKRAYEDQQRNAAVAAPAIEAAGDWRIPPIPELPAEIGNPPAPLIPERPAAPAFGNLTIEAFHQFPAPPAAGAPAAWPTLPAEREADLRRRALLVALELGDNLFLRRRFRDALPHFEFCWALLPEHPAIRLRVERCRLLAPPTDSPSILLPPRLAVLDFPIIGEPASIPLNLTWWTPEHLAPYFSPTYELVNRAELFWWMGRLGITTRDLLIDPAARLYLGRALRARYFLLGHLVHTGSFDVTTYVVDAEFGFMTSSARIHVRNANDLKVRLAELAWLTNQSPEERLRIEQQSLGWEKTVIRVRQAMAQSPPDYALCVNLCQRMLKQRPNHVEVRVLLERAERQQRQTEQSAARQRDSSRWQSAVFDWQERQKALARQAELTRLESERLAADRSAAERGRLATEREQAFRALLAQARQAAERRQFADAAMHFESALALKPNDEPTLREWALARARVEEATRTAATAAAAARQRALHEQQLQALQSAQARLKAERPSQTNPRSDEPGTHGAWVRGEHDRLLTLAKKLSAEGSYDQAVAAVQAARRIQNTPEAERLQNQWLTELARVNAEKRGAAAKAALDQQLTEERQNRAETERLATQTRAKYESLLAEAELLLRQEQFERAEEQYTAARKIYATDAALSGVRRAQAGLQKKKQQAEAVAQENERQRRRHDLLRQELTAAEDALAKKNYDLAIRRFTEAKKLDPQNETVLVGLAQAEHARRQEAQRLSRESEEAMRQRAFRTLLNNGKANLEAKKYDAAALALAEALKLYPHDAVAKAAYDEAKAGVERDAVTREQFERKKAEYERLMTDGRRALAAKQSERAVESFRQALRLIPSDKAAQQFYQEAMEAKTAADRETADKVMRGQRSAILDGHLAKIRTALSAGNIDEANVGYRLASAIDASDPRVKQALADIRQAQDAKSAAENEAKKRQQEFASLLNQARDALAARRHDDAVRLASQAVKLLPTNSTARELLAQATKQRDDANQSTARADMQARLKSILTDANAARTAKKYDEAGKLLAEAAKLAPGDAAVVKAQAALTQARQAADAESKKRRDAYAAAMTAARSALQGKRWEEAQKAVAAALQQAPTDKDALALRQQIETARTAEAHALREVDRLIAAGRAALAAKKYDAAAKHALEALKLAPKNADALKLQDDIDKAKSPAPPTTPKPPPIAYTKQMDAGAQLESKQQYLQALAAYQAALRAMPGDDRARNKASFCQNMADGQAALAGKKFAVAVKHFEAALKFSPDDAAAKDLLKRSQNGK